VQQPEARVGVAGSWDCLGTPAIREPGRLTCSRIPHRDNYLSNRPQPLPTSLLDPHLSQRLHFVLHSLYPAVHLLA
jgi:hypothetical protein